jgi:hypothetical protein
MESLHQAERAIVPVTSGNEIISSNSNRLSASELCNRFRDRMEPLLQEIYDEIDSMLEIGITRDGFLKTTVDIIEIAFEIFVECRFKDSAIQWVGNHLKLEYHKRGFTTKYYPNVRRLDIISNVSIYSVISQ